MIVLHKAMIESRAGLEVVRQAERASVGEITSSQSNSSSCGPVVRKPENTRIDDHKYSLDNRERRNKVGKGKEKLRIWNYPKEQTDRTFLA